MQQNQTVSALQQMKLSGFVEAFQSQLQQPNTYNDLGFTERFGLLVDSERIYRENKKYARLIKNAKLKLAASTENIDYGHVRGLSKELMANILTLDWMTTGNNILITGSTGCGKTYLACAIGNAACLQGFSVKYYRANRLFEDLAMSHNDGSYIKLMPKLAKTDLLIIDDWGLNQLTAINKSDLLEIMEDRYNVKSTIVTSQLPIMSWHEYMADPTVADAILDRLLHNAHKIELKGESMRKVKNNLTQLDQVK